MASRTQFPGDLSPFPLGYEGLELFINGTWTDVSADLSNEGITITRGRSSEGQRVDPSSMSCALKNSNGKYSPRNPNSPYYGLIGRNTPVRVYVDLGNPWINLSGTNANVTTPDTAALSITGDLEIQWEGALHSWSGQKIDLMSKYGATGQRSWALQVESAGTISLYWSADGTSLLSATSTMPVPTYARSLALKVTLDVNNGSGGRTTTFYYAETVNGPWTQLGDAVVAAGTTSIFDSTASVTIGKNANTSALSTDQRVYAVKILQGIGGTVRANVLASGLTVGASSFSDGTNTWTVNSPASISNRHYRFWGYVMEWPQKWTRKGAEGAYARIECSGVLRRFNQGTSVLRSVFYRAFSSLGSDLVGYWPCEDQQDSTSLSVQTGTRAGRIQGSPSLASYSEFAGTNPIPTLQDGRLTFYAPVFTATGEAQVRFMGHVPAGTTDGLLLGRIRFAGGSLGWVDIVYDSGVSGQWELTFKDDENNQIGLTQVIAFALTGKNARYSFEFSNSGSDVAWTASMYEVGAASGLTVGGTLTGHSVGRVTYFDVNPSRASLGAVAVGHVTMEKNITSLFDVSASVLAGYAGDSAESRIVRLAAENDVSISVVGGQGSTCLLGGQNSGTFPSLVQEAADSDSGFIYEPRNSDDLAYRTLESIYSQPALTIGYTDNLLTPFEPVDDDQGTRNRVTVTRQRGTSFTAELTSGALSTQDPPNGVGVYDEDISLSLYTDEQTEEQANWRLLIGTTDEARWPVIGFNLAHPTFLSSNSTTKAILDLDLGDRLLVNDIPDWLPPFPVNQIIQGYTEKIEPYGYTIQFNCTPASPYNVLHWNRTQRWSGAGTVLAANITTTTATSFTVTPPSGVAWTSADGNYDIVIGGERMTVTNVSGNTFTVVRSVNGVAKTHNAGAAVSLFEPAYWGL